MSDIGHNSGAIAKDRLQSFIERIERLSSEKDTIATDIKEVFAEAKSAGFDVKIMRKAIARRKMDKELRDEQDALLAMYEDILN